MSATPDAASGIGAIRARLLALAAAHARGELGGDAYEAARREAERTLSDAVMAAPATALDASMQPHMSSRVEASPVVRPAVRPSRRLVLGLVVVVASLAIGGYAFTGSPSLALLGVAPPAAPSSAPEASASPEGDREIGLQQIASMVDKLATRLKERPDDADGWTMLARSYTVLTRYADALPAYQHAIALQPKNAGLLADYSDAMAAANGGKASAESLALIDRALAIDPEQPKALALAGTAAFDRGDYPAAVKQWQKIADALPADSEFHQQVIANIDEARRRGGLGGGASASRAASNGTPTPSGSASPSTSGPSAAMPAASAAPGHEALTGVVSLSPAIASQAAPGDTVFVLARAEGGRMPLAVFRATVKDLPLRFRLDDSMAMAPTMKISDMKQVVVAARVSKSGNAITQAGDLSGESRPVAPGTTGLAIEIGNVVPAK